MNLFGWRFALGLLVAAGLGWGEWRLYARGRDAGRAEVQARWDKQVSLAQQAASAQAAVQQKAVNAAMGRYEQQRAREKVIYRDIIKEVPTYVPSDLPVLPGSFRVLHDAAASGSELPEAGGAGGVDASAVAVGDVAETLINNYERCHNDQRRLSALQELLSHEGR